MRISNELLDCVVFLGLLPEGRPPELKGTAFIVGVPVNPAIDQKVLQPHFAYLVTAKHVALELQGKKFVVLANKEDGNIRINCGDDNQWLYHPSDPSVDAAVMTFPIDFTTDLRVKTIPISMFADVQKITDAGIGIGDDVFTVGLFARYKDTNKNWPIVRTGSIAMMPEEPVRIKIENDKQTIDAEMYMIEARSIGGISGSPVFVRPTSNGWLPTPSRDIYLLGLMQGHWDLKYSQDLQIEIQREDKDGNKGVNTGIALAVPAKKILEVLNQPQFEREREEERKNQNIGNSATPNTTPT